ncbi:isoleucine--tRNA ligase [Taibaiella sp. KBW10]|uniref:isoleucine--tRNA ligase n=1 Tax=Taibaiella sp. KBW10 TaxID=2153357 RepID=UPI000F590DFF|nr:isoleucine--tRNA ligase [Taibaiella sp. KBW10]RQO32081.1 isoleucine--tRNA ligase [Taibaiella sp. KBW10]
MSNKYPEYKQLNMPAIEQDQHQKWDAGQFFQKSMDLRTGSPAFVFYEGPPSANGMPGIHHVISRTLKDLVCRYKTMQGFQVKRKAGWDTHGLPVELGVEKMLGITKEDIGKKISVADYNDACRKEVMKFKDKWDEITKKMGYWVDLSDPYITFDNNYIESLWWCLSELYKKGLLYKSVSIQPYSPAAGTGLSSHELNQPGTYKDVKDTSATVMFRLTTASRTQLGLAESDHEIYFMAWTTTPWTLPSNAGLTVGPNIDYVVVHTLNPYTHQAQRVIVAQPLVAKYFKAEGENQAIESWDGTSKILPWTIEKTVKGKELEGLRYEQLLPFESNKAELSGGDPFRVILGDFVTTEDGTGIVHTAPAFGADDYKVGQKNNIGLFNLVDREGKFVEDTGEYAGRFVKNYKDDPNYEDVNVDISVFLKQKGQAFKVEKYEHSYPHCWRTDKPIIYYPLDAWFIKTTALKDQMVALNKTINWKPKATGEGRFGNWLENMVDWNLSRSRYWGTPLPIWVSEEGTKKCIGSVAELEAEIKKAQAAGFSQNVALPLADLHKPVVDDIVLIDEHNKPMYREPDLIDVWFDSGAMPYAQWHFPFENKEIFAQNYPADFIAEGVDQTRGWFYTLHALGSLLKDSVHEELRKAGIEVTEDKYPGVAYKTVIANGFVLDKDGNKMSKRLGNMVDPFATIEKYSADATRWYLITNASPWDSLRFDVKGIEEIQRKFFGTLYNTYQFFALYANVDGFAFEEAYIPVAERPEIDRWILSSLNTLIATVTKSFDEYEPTQAGRAIENFVDEHLSNWYVRLCRRRFWKGEYEFDKIAAYQTLFECLEKLSLLVAPISPFFADWLFNNLNGVSHQYKEASVHHALFPKSDTAIIDTDLEERMQKAQDICSLVLSIRKKVNIKVRQPLHKIMVPAFNQHDKDQLALVKDLILSEVNVKELEFLSDDGFIKKRIKPNFKTLGKKVGAKMKAVAAYITDMSDEQIASLEHHKHIAVNVEGTEVFVDIEDVDIIAEDIPGWSVANKDNITVALDISLDDDLLEEGNAREIVNRIQKIRKDKEFALTDRILVQIENNDAINGAVNRNMAYISTEILADKIELVNNIVDGISIEVNDLLLAVSITKNS